MWKILMVGQLSSHRSDWSSSAAYLYLTISSFHSSHGKFWGPLSLPHCTLCRKPDGERFMQIHLKAVLMRLWSTQTGTIISWPAVPKICSTYVAVTEGFVTGTNFRLTALESSDKCFIIQPLKYCCNLAVKFCCVFSQRSTASFFTSRKVHFLYDFFQWTT